VSTLTLLDLCPGSRGSRPCTRPPAPSARRLAGLALADGGHSVQRLSAYFPPSEQYTVETEVWDPLPVAVRIPADPRRARTASLAAIGAQLKRPLGRPGTPARGRPRPAVCSALCPFAGPALHSGWPPTLPPPHAHLPSTLPNPQSLEPEEVPLDPGSGDILAHVSARGRAFIRA
jgi:hypothetical protein